MLLFVSRIAFGSWLIWQVWLRSLLSVWHVPFWLGRLVSSWTVSVGCSAFSVSFFLSSFSFCTFFRPTHFAVFCASLPFPFWDGSSPPGESYCGVGLTKHCMWKFTFRGRSIENSSEARSRLYEAVPVPWGVWGTPDKADEGPSGGTLRVVAFQAGE
jgi:hypothetical protein